MFEQTVDAYHDTPYYQEFGGDEERNFYLASIAISLKRLADMQARQTVNNFNISPLRSDTIC